MQKFFVRCLALILLPFVGFAGQPGLNDPAQSKSPVPSLREQAEIQQQWLKLRLDRVLPPLMRKHGV